MDVVGSYISYGDQSAEKFVWEIRWLPCIMDAELSSKF